MKTDYTIEQLRAVTQSAFIHVYEVDMGDIFYTVSVVLKGKQPQVLLPPGWYYRTQVAGAPVVENSVGGPFTSEREALENAFESNSLHQLAEIVLSKHKD